MKNVNESSVFEILRKCKETNFLESSILSEKSKNSNADSFYKKQHTVFKKLLYHGNQEETSAVLNNGK